MREVLSQAGYGQHDGEDKALIDHEVARVKGLADHKALRSSNEQIVSPISPSANPLSTKAKGVSPNVRFTENESIDVTADQRNSMQQESVDNRANTNAPLQTEITVGMNESMGIKAASNTESKDQTRSNQDQHSHNLRSGTEAAIKIQDERAAKRSAAPQPKSAKVIFDKDAGQMNRGFELASELDYKTETEMDVQSRLVTREAHRYAYGMDDRGGPAGFVNTLAKPTTVQSNVTRLTKMTRMTNQTGITRINQAGLRPYIDKVQLKGSKFDVTSKLDAVSTQTRRIHSNVRNGNMSMSRREDSNNTISVNNAPNRVIGNFQVKGAPKYVTIA